MQPFKFADDGPSVAPGHTACVNATAILRNPAGYADPHEFDGRRFLAERNGGLKTSKFTDVSADFPLWGFGGAAW